MQKNGMTLIELVIAMAMTSVVAVLGFLAVQTSSRSMVVASAQEQVQGNIRDVLAEMTREVELASSKDEDPYVLAIKVNRKSTQPEFTFQTPLDASGMNWSSPITYRYVNEDKNGNCRLDEGEDLDQDGVLSRRIVRIQDDERRPVGGANDLSNVTFVLAENGKVLDVTLTARTPLATGREDEWAESVATSRIALLN